MKPVSKPRLSYANVMSTIAVVFALGTGGAYAASTIGSAEVIDESLRGADVQNGTLTGADVLNGSLSYADLADNTLGGAKVADGGLTGADLKNDSIMGADVQEASLGNVPSASNAAFATSAGHATSAGSAPIQGYQVIYRQAPIDNQVDKEQTVDVPCPAGKRPIAGGGMGYSGALNPDGNEVAIVESRPIGATYGPDDNRPDGWRVKAEATDRLSYNSAIYVTAYAVCAKTDMP